jgi:hypothetical protein
MVTVVHLGDLGKGPHHGHGGGRWGRGGWGGGWPGYYDYGPIYYEAPENRYVILDPTGKAVAVVKGTPHVPPGYSFRLATVSEMATGLPTSFTPMAGFGLSPMMQRYAAGGAPQNSSIYGGDGGSHRKKKKTAAPAAVHGLAYIAQARTGVIKAVDASVAMKAVDRGAVAITPTAAKTMRGLADYVVTGPEGELYGRYKTYPTPAQIPIYAMVTQEGMSGVF